MLVGKFPSDFGNTLLSDLLCRQAKVKCVHEGQPPCQRCLKTKNQGCNLTDPRASRLRTRRNTSLSRTSDRSCATGLFTEVLLPAPLTTDDTAEDAFFFLEVLDKDPIAALSPATVISAVETYRKKFPITNFLHYPSLISEISSNVHSVDSVFVASVLSLCVRFMNSDELREEEIYADYARNNLAQRVLEAPSLHLGSTMN
jgi:hypothetical protein